MNNTGWVAGSSNLVPGGPQHAFLWYGARSLVDLGTLGGLNSGADGPNVYGEAAIGSELRRKTPITRTSVATVPILSAKAPSGVTES
jgi:probable HAF family extracellular repeat protein